MSDPSKAASSKAAAPDPLIGRTINDRFKIVSLLARGGMGKVYRAEQTPLGRACALKVLNPNYAGDQDPEFHKRFFLEASVASKLTHPNTVTIFDYGKTDDDVYYMAMEYLDGITLHRALRNAGGPLGEDRTIHIAMQVCRSLREAHALGVIHRDLKPANIFLVKHGDEADFVKVLDFGLVKAVSDDSSPEDQLTKTGLFMGSPKYMSPEQIRGEKVDARTDVYGLGIILYEMMCGKVPFERQNSMTTLMAHVNDKPLPLEQMNPNAAVSAAMKDVVFRCLEKDPDARFASMDEVLGALKRIAGSGAYPSMTPGSMTSGAYAALAQASGSFRATAASSGQYGAPSGSFTPGASIAPPSETPPGIGPQGTLPPPGTPPVVPPAPSSIGPKAIVACAAAAVLVVAAVAVGWRTTRPTLAAPSSPAIEATPPAEVTTTAPPAPPPAATDPAPVVTNAPAPVASTPPAATSSSPATSHPLPATGPAAPAAPPHKPEAHAVRTAPPPGASTKPATPNGFKEIPY